MKNLIKAITFSLFLLGLWTCSTEEDIPPTEPLEQSITQRDTNFIFTNDSIKIPTGVHIPTTGKWINPDSVNQPETTLVKSQPEKQKANNNVHPVTQPQVTKISKLPEKILIDTSQLKKVPANGKIVQALHPKPTPASLPQYKDNNTFDIQYLNVDQGMLSSVVNSVLEDSQGYLWFGTKEGLSRYDGNSFIHFTTKEGLSHNEVTKIYEDSKGHFWFGTKGGGVNRYDGKYFTHFTTEGGLSHNEVNEIFEDTKGYFWFGTNEGLNRYDGKSFTHLTPKDGLVHHYIYSIAEDSQGNLWIGTLVGISRYDGRSFTNFTKNEGLLSNVINIIYEDSQGYLWFGISGKGASRYDGEQLTHFTPKEGLNAFRSRDGNFCAVYSVEEDSRGNLWFGILGGGVDYYDGKSFTHFTITEGLSSNAVRVIYEDSQGYLWVGTRFGGVNRIDPASFAYLTTENGLIYNYVRAISEDSQGNIWIGSTIGLSCYDGEGFAHYTTKGGLGGSSVKAIVEDSKGNLWSGAAPGIKYYDGKGLTHYTTKEGLSHNTVYAICEDSQGQIWVGTKAGLNRYDGKSFTHFTTKQGLINDKIYSILEDSRGQIWVGTDGGLSCYDGKGFIHYTTKEGLSHNTVYAICEDSQGQIWVGTKVGLNHYDGKNFTHYSTIHGLSSGVVKGIQEDNQGRIWVGTEGGLSVLSQKVESTTPSNKNSKIDYSIFEFERQDGLKKYNDISALHIDKNNRIWLAIETGVITLDINNFKLPDHVPSIDLAGIEINQNHVDYNRLSDEAYAAIFPFGKTLSTAFDSVAAFQNYPVSLSLPHHLNDLTFQFSAIDWTAPHKLKYSYFMEGMDATWTNPDSKNKANYRSIPHGTYTFKVKAMGESEKWSEPFEYTFTIHPPWWLTWWAKAFYAILFIGILISLWQIEKRKQQQKLEAQQRINQVTSKFVPTAFINSLGRKDIMEVQLGDAIEQEITVLFLDIRDYTTLSEGLSPEENFRFVTAFNKRMGPIIQRNEGFVNQYLGDAIMALFKKSPYNALKAAIQMQQELKEYNQYRISNNRQPIKMGIGFHTGSLIMGIIGDDQRMDAATISDAVNTASRIEGLTKYYKSNIILSEESLQQIQSDQPADGEIFHIRYLGQVLLKGKREPLGIYECFNGDDPNIITKKLACQILFKKAMDYYWNKQFHEAANTFEKIRSINPDDLTAELFYEKAKKHLSEGIAEDWTGVEVMSFK